MKNFVLLTLIIFVGATVSKSFAQKKKSTTVVCFKSDMDCSECETTIFEHLKFEKGVKDLKVSHATNTIYVEYKKEKNTDKSLAQAIEEKGYKAEKISLNEFKEISDHLKESGHKHGAEVHRVRK